MMATPVQRPGSLRRSSSYGFGTQPTPGSPSGFEGDAFAPLYQQTYTQPSDPWSRTHPSADVKHYPWAAVGAQQDSFAFRPAQQFGGADERNQQIGPRAPPTPPEEDEEMVEDTGDCGMYEEDKEGKAEGGMEWDSNRNERAEDKHVGGDWQRGRRKQQ